MKDVLKWVMYGAVFAVPFVLLYVASSMFFPYITGKNFAFRILVEIGFGAWVALVLIDKAYRPRFSWVLMAIAGLLVVMFSANILGEFPLKSFWSNFERMEGWVTLAHFFMYFLVLGSVLRTEKLWNWFFNTALVAGVIMSLYALGQVAGTFDISQGGNWRVDARLGNSTYVGVYMLFHMFIAAWLFICTKSTGLRVLYAGLVVLFGFILFNTGTRGTVLGLVGGSALAFSYLALMAPRGAAIKKWALGGFLAVVLVAGGLWVARDSAFVKESQMLNRFANITVADGGIRFTIWEMAFEGVKERPILGWGQENFSYVFNKYYNPSLYGAEAWYDRTHNIFMDWLIAGGVLGLIAYLSVLVAALWGVVVLPASRRLRTGVLDEKNFTVLEQALILGLLAAYMFHNLFVFDNLGSWIFYAVVLALIHSRVAREVDWIEKFSIGEDTWKSVVVPATTIVLCLVVWFVNVPGISAAQGIIKGYRANTVDSKLNAFTDVIADKPFAQQEVVEQFGQVGGQIIAAEGVTDEQKKKTAELVEKSFLDLIAEKPGDARLHVILGSFYRSTNDLNKALEQFEMASQLSPKKQVIIEEIALVYMLASHFDEAVSGFQKAYELDERNLKTKVRLATAMLYSGDEDGFERLVGEDKLEVSPELKAAYINEQMLVQVLTRLQRFDLMEGIFLARIANNPIDTDSRVNLAAVYFEQGDREKAIGVIENAIKEIPSFKEDGEAILKNIESM